MLLKTFLIGQVDDKFVAKINVFALNIFVIRNVLTEEYSFPLLITNLFYFPISFIILLLNVLQQDIRNLLMTVFALCLMIFLIGVLFTFIFVMIRGITIHFRE